jgi:hypothetical protein
MFASKSGAILPIESLTGFEHISLIDSQKRQEQKKTFLTLTPGACTIKLITAVIYVFL